MFEAVKTMLSQTPWWVYLLLWLLIQRGIAASKTQVVPLAKNGDNTRTIYWLIFVYHYQWNAYQCLKYRDLGSCNRSGRICWLDYGAQHRISSR